MRFRSAFKEKGFGVIPSPFGLPLSIFAQDYSEADASASITVFAFLPQAKHPVTQLVANDCSRRRTTPVRSRRNFNAPGTNPNALGLSWSTGRR